MIRCVKAIQGAIILDQSRTAEFTLSATVSRQEQWGRSGASVSGERKREKRNLRKRAFCQQAL